MNDEQILQIEAMLKPTYNSAPSEGVIEELEREIKMLRRCVAVLTLHFSSNTIEDLQKMFDEGLAL